VKVASKPHEEFLNKYMYNEALSAALASDQTQVMAFFCSYPILQVHRKSYTPNALPSYAVCGVRDGSNAAPWVVANHASDRPN
jgi:hypothetical protein